MATTQATIEQILQTACSGNEALPGALFGAMDRKGNYLVEARAGYKGIDRQDEEMTFDTVFALFSCTKIVSAMAVMQLVDQGKVDLDQPAELYLPDLKDVKLVDGSQPKTKITTRHLLSHTSGHAYPFFSPELAAIFKEQGIEVSDPEAVMTMPLIAHPGEDWNYGVGLDWASRLLERVTGQTLGAWSKNNIFDPLGAYEIAYSKLPVQDKKRFVSLHARSADGTAIPIDHFPSTLNPPFDIAGSGILGTLDSFLKVILVLVNDGVGANGVRILKKETVDEMFRDQLEGQPVAKALDRAPKSLTPAVAKDFDFLFNLGVEKGFGLTGLMNKQGLASGRSAGSLHWAGLANLYWVADRQRRTVSLFCTQILPFGDTRSHLTWQECETTLNAAHPTN